MAMSLKKITAIAVGGAMVASTLASGVAAETVVIGDVKEFMKNVVKDGKPNVDIVVGSKAAAMDVVAAADIAAKIGSMCYKDTTVEEGSAELSISVSADTETSDEDLKDDATFRRNGEDKDYVLVFTTPKRKYTKQDGLGNIPTLYLLLDSVSDNDIARVIRLARLSTLVMDDDADPQDIGNTDEAKDADAIEFLLASVKKDNDVFKIEKNGLVYGSLMLKDGEKDVDNVEVLRTGMEIPLLGEIYRVVYAEDKTIYLGKEAYTGNVKEGDVIDIGNGYQVKVESVLQPINRSDKPEVTIKIIKDGNVVTSKSKKIPFELVYKDVGVIVYSAYKNIAETYGYASLIITKDVKGYELGKTFEGNWKIYGIKKEGIHLVTTKEDIKVETGRGKTHYLQEDTSGGEEIVGLALRYEGDDIKNIDEGDAVAFVDDYAKLEFTDDGDSDKVYVKYVMDISKDVVLDIGQKIEILNAVLKLKDIKATAQEVVPVRTPIAKLDTEASLDTDKYLILVGGPVANKLTEELQKQGKVNINNDSPATLQVVDGRILVVAGGDRYKTREAALHLIQNY